ncbi:MAG: hypothetical protein ABI461_15985 [Polyangiaceae bacterium]
MSEDEEREAEFARIALGRGESPTGALAIYRRLVRTGIGTTIFKLLPRSRARMNALHDDAFDLTLVDFLHEVGPRSHHMRDVVFELMTFAEPRWREKDFDGASIDLARYEAACFALESAPDDTAIEIADVDLDRAVVLSRAVRLLQLQHAVHEVAENAADGEPIAERAVALLLHRNAQHTIAGLELTPVLAGIMNALQEGRPLRAAIATGAEHANAIVDDALLRVITIFLADLGARGILRGGKAG